MYVSGTEQNHGKPQDRVASQIVFHGFPFYDLIYYYSMAFQTGSILSGNLHGLPSL